MKGYKNMKKIMKSFCGQLNGWNFEEIDGGIRFDFWTKNGNAILTLIAENNEIKLSNIVEYYENDTDYEHITLKEYEEKIISEGFMEEIQKNTIVSIQNILKGIGYKTVVINFK